MPLVNLIIPDIRATCELNLPDESMQLGALIYLDLSVDQQLGIAERPTPGFTKYAVTDISRGGPIGAEEKIFDVVVRSVTPEDFHDTAISELADILSGIVEPPVIAKALRNIAAQYRVQDMGLTAAQRASPANTFVTVAWRLDLCRKLAGYAGADLIGTHQRNLVVYLLLTCFDRLGQPAPHLPFENWLDSKKQKHRQQREAALVDVAPDAIAQARALNRAYIAEYGVRNSFFRFMDEVLPRPQYDALISSIWSLRTSWIDDAAGSMNEEEIRKYLYQLRNAYTHQAEAQPGLTIPFPDGVPVTPAEATFYLYEQLKTRGGMESISFRDWPKVLEDCVLHGLAERVRRHAEGAES